MSDEDRTNRRDRIFVEDVKQDVKSHCEAIHNGDDIHGGIVCTGFFDIEKLIHIHEEHKHDSERCHHRKKVLFLEKVLPFQLLIVRIE